MTNHEIEREGTRFLKQYLEGKGRTVRDSDRKTFDLIVDEKYAEVKTKAKSFDCFDFLALSEEQYQALIKGEPFILFLVLGVRDPDRTRVVEISSELLSKVEPKEWKQYFWDKGMLDSLWRELHGEPLSAFCERAGE